MEQKFRKFIEKKLLIASNNEDKAKELANLLESYGKNIEIISLASYNFDSPDETGITFKENADLKAIHYSNLTNLPSLADDSGLVIDALDGAPGIYSARWAGEERDFQKAIEKVEIELKKKGLSTSKAHFMCSLSLRWNDGAIENFEGRINGHISFPPKGESGFGYDSIFTPIGYDKTFADLGGEVKDKISHRAIALKLLIDSCFK